MIQLKTRGFAVNIPEKLLAIVLTDVQDNEIVCFSSSINLEIVLSTRIPTSSSTKCMVVGIPSLMHLSKGDIVLIDPNGTINTLFRKQSFHNSLFITDRCNSNCLMCSQPPKNFDDLDHHFKINTELISLLPKTIKELGITGGEPTLLGRRFITLLEQINLELPTTNIHILTNGRVFAWKNVVEKLQRVENKRTVYGIPLYSDYYQQHDYIVQVKGAFRQTILGFHNMARYGLRLELRIVLHLQSYKRLPSLSKYIYKNLPFVEHVAFMGLEHTGYAIKNNDILWIDPKEYADELEESIMFLDTMGLTVSIYNLQLCLLKPSLWKFARKSISDWKQKYLDECVNCALLSNCGGVFTTSKVHSNYIKAVTTIAGQIKE